MAFHYATEMSFRLAAYAVCIDNGRVLLAHHVPSDNWTLPGGRVEHAEDPFAARHPGSRRGDRLRRGRRAPARRRLARDSRSRTHGRRTCAPECRHLLPGAHHRRRVATRAQRRDHGTDLDSDPRRRHLAPFVTGRCRPRPGADSSGNRPRRSGPGWRPDPALSHLRHTQMTCRRRTTLTCGVHAQSDVRRRHGHQTVPIVGPGRTSPGVGRTAADPPAHPRPRARTDRGGSHRRTADRHHDGGAGCITWWSRLRRPDPRSGNRHLAALGRPA